MAFVSQNEVAVRTDGSLLTSQTQYTKPYSVVQEILTKHPAKQFLQLLDPTTDQFCFRTFDDTGREGKFLAKKRPGTFEAQLSELEDLNRKHAGVFVVINSGGDSDDEITKIRAVFADTDGAQLEPLLILKPHVVIESSPGKWHVYWFVDSEFGLDKFSTIQKAIAAKYGTDLVVHNLSRVMRLPGFYHCKNAPVKTKLIELNEDLPRYSHEEIVGGLGLELQSISRKTIFPDLSCVTNDPFSADIKEGGRNSAVIKYIGYMRKRGIPEDLLPKVAMDYNIARCKPPLDEVEVCDLVNRYKHQAKVASDSTSEAESNSVAWPEIKPLPPKNPPTPFLDTELLPSPIQAYVKDCAERLQVPPEMIATPLLISFGNVIGKKAAVYPKRNDFSWYEYPNLWGCCVAPPASLKSPALTAGLRFSREIEVDMRAIFDRQLRTWKLNEKLRKASARNIEKAAVAAKEAGDEAEAHKLLAQLDEIDPPVCGRLTTNDATPEARLELLRQNPNGLMQVVDELDGHFQRLNRDGYESARAQELTFYDGKDDYAEDRVKRGSSFVESPRIAMYGNLQPAKVEGYMRALNTGGRDDGYLQRLFQLVVWPTLSPDFQQSNNPEDMVAQEAVREVFNAVHCMQLERDPISQIIKPKALRFTPEAQDEFDRIYVARERENRKKLEANPVLAAHRGKMVGTLIKLSMICALLENPRVQHIDRQALETALRLVNFYYAHAKRAYMAATRGGVLAAHALLAKIKAGKVPNPFSARDDIYERKWAGLNAAETHEAISILIEHGYLHTEEVLTVGRPRRVYFINPLFTGG